MIRNAIRRWVSLPLSRRARRERDVDHEIRMHIGLRAQRLIEQGYSEDAAWREAERRFGGARARADLLSDAHERERIMTTREWFAEVGADVRFVVRQLLHAPAFAIAVVATLALGVGANATMFGVIDRLLLRAPAHIREPGRVVLPSVHYATDGHTVAQRVLSFPIFRDLAGDSSFTGVAAFSPVVLTLGSGPTARELSAVQVTPEYFALLGVRPVAGRFFDPRTDPEVPADREAVVSESFWMAALGGSSDALERTIELGGAPYRVIGVAPRGFTGTDPSQVDVWIPLTAGVTPAEIAKWRTQRDWYSLFLVARVRDGLTLAGAAESATRAVRDGVLRGGASPEEVRLRRPTVLLTSTLPRDARGDRAESRVALLLAAMSVLVLVLAGVNVTNLQLGRAVRRGREVAIRLALGVSRRRLLRLLLTESILLALAGGVAALAVAWGGTTLMRATLLSGLVGTTATVDVRLVAYTAAAALAAGMLTGLLPALQSSRHDLISPLRAGSQPSVERMRARVGLLGVQSALALILLVGAGLFARSLARIEALPLGMDPEPVLVARLNTAGATYDDATLNEMLRALERNAAAAPQIEHAALSFTLPFGASASVSLALPGRDSVPVTSEGGPYVNAVGADYFAALGTPIVAGRAFTADDAAGAARVVIVNETAARLWWPREEAVGKCVHLLDRTMPCATVVGVAANSRRQSLTEDETVQVFAPAAQSTVWAQPRLLLVRVRGGAPESTDGIQRVLQSAVPGLPYVNVSRLADRIASRTRSWQLGAIMFGAFASLAIVLAAIGLYGVLAYDVSQRTREIGVRLALGSGALDVAAMVVRQGLIVASLGAAVGLATALVASSRVEQLLFQTSPLDPVVYLVALGVILFTAAVASWIPARRAGRVDPMVALRGE